MHTAAIFSASDKALFDALNQKNVTNASLRELFLSRGILVSRDTSRKELAKNFSRLCHDYDDYLTLANLFGTHTRRDRMSSSRIETTVKLDAFEKAALKLKADLEADGAVVKVSKSAKDRVTVDVKYKSVHFNRSEFRQIEQRSVSISIEQGESGISIYSPRNDDADEWVTKIATLTSETTEVALVVEELKLPLGFSAEQKTNFFREMIEAVKGYKLVDVSDVYVSKPKDVPDSFDEAEDDDPGEPKLGIHISKASLKGEGVLQSEELKLLFSKGFYVSKVVWIVRGGSSDADNLEFEAQFSNAENCSGFSYLPRGFYKRQEAGYFNETRTGFSSEEDRRFGKLIDEAARVALAKVVAA